MTWWLVTTGEKPAPHIEYIAWPVESPSDPVKGSEAILSVWPVTLNGYPTTSNTCSAKVVLYE